MKLWVSLETTRANWGAHVPPGTEYRASFAPCFSDKPYLVVNLNLASFLLGAQAGNLQNNAMECMNEYVLNLPKCENIYALILCISLF